MSRSNWSCLAAALALAIVPPAAPAQTAWPQKPVTIIVPFPPGGGTDLVVRALQPMLAGKLGQTIIINNVGGAGGTIGSGQAARAPADGYTALAVTTSTHAVSPSLYKNLPYDPSRDFAYAGFIGTSPYVLAANPALKANSLAALAQALKARGQSTFASVGVGTVSHLLGEMYRKEQNLNLTHVPYRGAAPAYTDLIGGQVDIMFDNPVGLAPFVRAGKLVAVATTAATPILPAVPTFAQQGMPAYTQQLWYGLAFPKGTPPDIVTRMNAALNEVLKDPAVAADLASKGVDVHPDTPAALSQAVTRDTPFWGNIVRSVGAQLD
ncbi:Tripartite tricarboxylate transporter substrate binding protein [Bordetella sputigena]|uniref:Bug family tripartite tricarboxylate transporter substrate binding protein n=1 Tax=Bordetella sputigena TaxID=1416810 RepID=UPI0039EF50A7